MKIPQDYHIHSHYSEDGVASLEELCLKAIELGIPEIGFSEHWDVGPYEQKQRYFKPKPWFKEIKRLREKFDKKLILRAGMEVAEPHLYPELAADLARQIPFDYIIGSVHWDGHHFMFDEGYYNQRTADKIYNSYFAELERMVARSDIDIVAHFDIPTRTAIPIVGYDPTRYKKQIQAILRIIIERGLALDINTSGKRKPANNLMPDARIIKWYAEMGGERVTLGSDAHQANQIGSHLGDALEAIRATGLSRLAQFEKRKVQFIPI